jgi:hypothetical protein
MAFIPPGGYEVGDRVRINQDLSNSLGTFQAGREFEIIDLHFKGNGILYDLRDHEQNVIGDVPSSNFSKIEI